MAGDMNMVEAGVIDRLPARDDPEDAVDALDDFKISTQLRDGWRDTYPDTKAYTFHQTATGSQSRIDRIYAMDPIMAASREWRIESTGVPGVDHWMVSVLASHTDAPTIGKGRWTIPRHIIKDKTFMQYAMKKGLETGLAMDTVHTQGRTTDRNAQIIWYHYKTDILRVACERQRVVMPRTKRQLEELQGKLQDVNNDDSLSEAEQIELSSTLTSDIMVLERKQFQDTRKDTATRNRVEGEQISKYWSSLNKENKPRDVIFALRREEKGPDGWFETSPNGMAKRARDYHEILQREGQATDDAHLRHKQAMTDKVLSNLNTNLTDEQKTYLAMKCDRTDVVVALLGAKNFGRDIAEYGVLEETHFADGWMCPLYKKNDKCEIANYRPITLLNTDYKIFTKVLATKLGKVAPSLLHPNQAGFVPGRQISDQTKLIRMVMASAEQTGQNGLIVSLDQEKAYDKVDHDYLWKTLEHFEFPKEFIETVQRLYKTAKMSVMINGVKTIEPLAAMLRNSHLQGFKIPGVMERLIANLFADDTTMFLAAADDFGDLQSILNEWCTVSTAKFNVNKTSIIPIEELLNTLPQKWDPRMEQPEDYEKGPHDNVREEDTEVFDYRISITGNLSDIFRIFTDEVDTSDEVLIRKVNHGNEETEITVATDGSCTSNSQEDAKAGAGVFYGHRDPANQSIRLPKQVGNVRIIQSNQAAELVAAMQVTKPVSKTAHVNLETDSRYVISHLTKGLRKMEDRGYIDVNNAEIIRAMIARYRLHEAPIHVKWVKGHSGHEGNEEADTLAGMAAMKTTEDEIDLDVPPKLWITGAKLKVLTQKLAYTAIRQRKSAVTPDRPRTCDIITQVKTQAQSLFDISPTDSAIWASIRSKDLERKTRYFLWMVANDAYMTGPDSRV
ncbi:hypothetical protein D9758_018330 [Tetrapyrgos nigripes]|uniref:RNase H type-1 domain-containing protein n=1 Tax=Tetrapyrgos nigripes TaxID=182062 RepID=A0A8H5C7D1_9AGAR|nr:hypothetical protein D9758_018330 [Tetrapyrgos nigripes]